MFSTFQVVPAGPYFGFTLAQLETELTAVVTARQNLSGSVIGASIAGQNFQFAGIDQQRAELERRQVDLQAAFAYLDPGRFPIAPPSNVAVVAFA